MVVPSSRGRSGVRRLSASHYELLQHYAWRADDEQDDSSHWRVVRIGDELGICERQVQRMTRDLETAGLISVERGGGRLRGSHRRPDGRFTGRANRVFVRLDRVTRTSPNGVGQGGYRVTRTSPNAEGYRVTPASPRSTQYLSSRAHKARGDVRFASPAGSAQVSVSQTRIASPAGSARADFLTSRASLGPGNGESEEVPSADTTRAADAGYARRLGKVFTDAKTDQPPPGEETKVCPICRRTFIGSYAEHACAPVNRPQPRSQELPPPPPMSEAELLAAHERYLAMERARMEASGA